MSTLLDQVLDAHGGRDRWAAVTGLTARVSLGGPFWAARGHPGIWDDPIIELDATRERISFLPLGTDGDVLTYDAAGGLGAGETIVVTDADGTVVDERTNPRASFPTFGPDTRWDTIQTGYFTSVAVWNYLMTPFLFTFPRVRTEEIEPWDEDGETWRRLAVHFPPELPNHNPDQVFYYDDSLRQRRMDYQPDVTGSAIAHYSHDPEVFDGFTFYTRRLIHPRRPDGTAVRDLAPITLHTNSIEVSAT